MNLFDTTHRTGAAFCRFATTAVLALGLLLAAPAPGTAQQEDLQDRVERLEAELDELREMLRTGEAGPTIRRLQRRIQALTRQIEQMRLGGDVVAADTSVLGFGPAASKVYKVQEGVSVGGYGEIVYENFASTREDGSPSGKTDQLDALRGVVYVGYKFSDRLLFNSEIEFEHGSTSGGVGSASLEFAYLDYRFSDHVGLRAGLLLPPVGFINELHEPPTFPGVNRPSVEQAIIPTTWRENGIGLFGSAGDVEYRAYLINSLDGVGGGSSPASGFGASGLRGGRQKGAKALAEDFGLVGRVDYTGTLGLRVGGSAFVGETGHNRMVQGEELDARTIIGEVHGEYRARGLDLRAMAVLATVDDVTRLNLARGLDGSESVGEELTGWYVQGGYDVLRQVETDHQLVPYLRYESLNTQAEVPEGFSADPATDRTVVVLGAQWKPHPNAVFKADYEIHSNGAETGVDQFNASIGYLF